MTTSLVSYTTPWDTIWIRMFGRFLAEFLWIARRGVDCGAASD